jgi:hypothetical protein
MTYLKKKCKVESRQRSTDVSEPQPRNLLEIRPVASEQAELVLDGPMTLHRW